MHRIRLRRLQASSKHTPYKCVYEREFTKTKKRPRGTPFLTRSRGILGFFSRFRMPRVSRRGGYRREREDGPRSRDPTGTVANGLPVNPARPELRAYLKTTRNPISVFIKKKNPVFLRTGRKNSSTRVLYCYTYCVPGNRRMDDIIVAGPRDGHVE